MIRSTNSTDMIQGKANEKIDKIELIIVKASPKQRKPILERRTNYAGKGDKTEKHAKIPSLFLNIFRITILLHLKAQ